MDKKEFIKRATELGAADAKFIPVKTIVAAEWVRLKCKFGCDGYGKRLTCPPHSPTPEETRKVLSFYKQALLIHGTGEEAVTPIAITLEKEFFLSGHEKAFAMGAGPCLVCKRCDFEDCKQPQEARPSMEACGIDVYSTVRANGFPIQVLKDERCKGNYYALVLVE